MHYTRLVSPVRTGGFTTCSPGAEGCTTCRFRWGWRRKEVARRSAWGISGISAPFRPCLSPDSTELPDYGNLRRAVHRLAPRTTLHIRTAPHPKARVQGPERDAGRGTRPFAVADRRSRSRSAFHAGENQKKSRQNENGRVRGRPTFLILDDLRMRFSRQIKTI